MKTMNKKPYYKFYLTFRAIVYFSVNHATYLCEIGSRKLTKAFVMAPHVISRSLITIVCIEKFVEKLFRVV